MKMWISMNSILDDLENVRRAQDRSIENDYEPTLEDLDKSPVPIFHFGRTNQNSTVFFNYNYLLRGGRRIAANDAPQNALRYFMFHSDDLMKCRSSKPLGYVDLLVDDRNKVKDILGIQRAFVTDENLDQGIREEIITSLMKTLEHELTIHTIDENVLRVLQNLGAIDTVTNKALTLDTKVARIPYDPDKLIGAVEMAKNEQRRVWNTRHEANP